MVEGLERKTRRRFLIPADPWFGHSEGGQSSTGERTCPPASKAPMRRGANLIGKAAFAQIEFAQVLLGSYDLTREEIWVNLIDRDRPHGLKEPARDPGGASVGVALPDDLDADRHAFDR